MGSRTSTLQLVKNNDILNKDEFFLENTSIIRLKTTT